MTACGAVVLVAQYYRRSAFQRTLAISVSTPELAALPLPFAVTNGAGTVLSVSDALLRLTGRTREQTEGRTVASLLPPDRESVELGGKTWRIQQSPMEDGRYCFRLEERQDTPAMVTLSPNFEDDASFIDPETSLFTRTYAVKSVAGELYRARRYQRPMSAALLRMVFTPRAGKREQPETEDKIFSAWCRFIHANIRISDISCLVGPRDVLVAMPETPLNMAREVAGKLASFEVPLQKMMEGFGENVTVYDGVAFFDSSSGDIDFDEFMKRLDEALRSEK
jgi:two-component system cell cycle response regulator